MIFLVVLGAAAAIVRWRAGAAYDLSSLEFRRLWLVAIAFVAQTVLFEAPQWVPEPARSPLHIATYALLAVFVVSNLDVDGMRIVAVGATANVVAIVANGGVMPATRWALRVAGMETTEVFTNSGLVAHPRLAFLGDVFAIPAFVPFANVFSIGDVILCIGFVVMLRAASGRPAPEAATAPAPAGAA